MNKTTRRALPLGSDVRILIILIAALLAVFGTILPGKYLTLRNFQSMAVQLPELGLLAIAMAVVMLTGGINLSIIATANACGIVIATILVNTVSRDAAIAESIGPVLLALTAGLTVSTLIGLVNGLLIACVGMSPILATLGTMTIVEGIFILVTRGRVISGFPELLLSVGNSSLWGIPISFLIFLAAAVLVTVLLERTPFGQAVYMIGSNSVATEFSGVNVRRTTVLLYALSGLLCGISSVIMVSRFNSARVGYGESYLLITVLACVLGGLNPDGGFGRIAGLVLGLGVLQMMSSGLNLLGFSAHLTEALWGAIILLILFVRRAGGSWFASLEKRRRQPQQLPGAGS
jgi:ribose/xylose/arabinose/galactoside ABC-type transport system permease subunit